MPQAMGVQIQPASVIFMDKKKASQKFLKDNYREEMRCCWKTIADAPLSKFQ